MNIKVITKDAFDSFAINHEHYTFHQHSTWGKVKESTNWTSTFVGFYEEEKLVGAALLLERKVPLGYKIVYSPRGILIDYSNINQTKASYELLSTFLKSRKTIHLIVDPYVIHKTYTNDCEELLREEYTALFEMFQSINYKHLGFTKYFETLQPRWMYRLKLNNYDQLLKTFHKNTKRNIRIADEKGIVVKDVDRSQLQTFNDILNSTAERRGFINRPTSYFENMYDSLDNHATFYIAYLDAKQYLKQTEELIKELNKEEAQLQHKLETENVGKKLLSQQKQLETQKASLEKKRLEAKSLLEEHPEPKPVGSLLSLASGNEYLSLLSGIDNNFRKFNPKYALYNKHIKDAIENGYEYSNFYGITGDFDKENPNYGIYEFKKGFNGEVNELVGQFEYVCNPLMFKLYEVAMKLRKIMK